jgi:hypothetical protein
MQKQETYVPWRDRAFLSMPEAAAIVARSTDRIRDWIGEGRIDGCRLTLGGPLVVMVPSLIRFVDEIEPAAPRDIAKPTRRPALRLVVDNTNAGFGRT